MPCLLTVRQVLIALTAVVAVLSAGCGGGGDTAAPVRAAQPGRVVSLTLPSQKVGVTYNIDVYLPASYDTSSAAYPTIYALDGDSRFDGINTRFDNFREILRSKGTNAILVGVGGTARRQTDYNFPGATAFHDFLATELIPLVDARFRTVSGKRMLAGISTSGNLAATALFLEATSTFSFSHFLSTEGAFWQQPDAINTLEQQMFDATRGRSIPVTLVLVRATAGTGTNATYVHDLFLRLDARRYAGLTLIETSFATGHVESDNPAFADVVGRIFP
ncbi:MAG: alpha/beta hydrolase-fold protein [Burkholderiales bacterium]